MADKMIKLYATRPMRVHGKTVDIGDQFEVPEPKAKEIIKLNRGSSEPVKKQAKETPKK